MAPDSRSVFCLRFHRTKISSSTIRMLTTRGTNTLKSRSGTLSRSPGVRLTPLQSEANSQARIGRAMGRSDLQRVLQKQRPQRGGSWGHYSSDAMGAFASGRAKPTRSRGIRSLTLTDHHLSSFEDDAEGV